MPYCELRFPQAPAQLLVSGLLGDLPAPAAALIGTYLASWPLGSSLTWALARRGSASAAALLVGGERWLPARQPRRRRRPPSPPRSIAPATAATTSPPRSARASIRAHSASRRGICWASITSSAGSGPPRAIANLPNVQTRVVTQQRSQAWFGASNLSDQTGQYNGPWGAPLAAASLWTVTDSGQAPVPALPTGALSDPAQGYLTPRAQWQDLSASGAAFRANWQALLPVDGSLLLGVANNPANGPFAVTTSWLWLYADGLLTTRGDPSSGPAATLSLEAAALANPARGGGGPGTQSSGSIGVNSGADPYLTLDPTIICAPGAGGMGAGGAGVNQLTALMADGAGAVLPIACDLVYTPLYLYPR